MAPNSWFSFLLALSAVFNGVQAIPTPSYAPATTPLSLTAVAAFKPYTWYTSAVACEPSSTKDWSCGANCDANPTFMPVESGGVVNETQNWYVGYDPTLDEVIVALSPGDLPAMLDLDIRFVPLDAQMFPGVDPGVLVHKHFYATQNGSAPGVIKAVKQALSLHSTKNVTVVGHSLGGATALLQAVYLSLNLPSNLSIRSIGYASPRVGNQAWANYVDSLPISTIRINNKDDPVPVLPFMEFMGYHHASNEVHIRNDDVWVYCPGQDNPSDQCSTGIVNITTAQADWHSGPYDGITLQCSS